MTTYRSTPIDTSAVEIPGSLGVLLERLAANTHEIWSAGRIREGWTYGPKWDDSARQDPCLVPYNALPESEKENDRATAREALKVILSLGYEITGPR